VPSEDGERHAVEIARHGGFRRIEISVRDETDDAALRVVKARESALTRVTAAPQDQRESSRLDSLARDGSK
jgi:hypothetical protein